ncbi:MAG TPA: M14 family metallopeptidase [Chloroflexia bacterium]|nr:M14 family metallopeptidase [Chloroflexia bacterium]
MMNKIETINFSRYLTYAEMTAALKSLAESYPDLARLESIGKSHEGRDLWLMTVTNFLTGHDADKPAYWIDANIHAAELTGSATALYTIQYLLENYGRDAEAHSDRSIALVNHLLDTRVFYIMPRHTPDGAERVLTTPNRLRSSTRPYPLDEDKDGLVAQDLDDDGVIRQMRIKDPAGDWKVSKLDPRLLIKRLPEDVGEDYYRVYTEGVVRNYDGYILKVPPTKEGLDLNRNYPYDWAPEDQQSGAGPFPLSEPETRAVVEFWATHRNITGSQSYHTFSGVILRPYSGKPDEAFPLADLNFYKMLGKRGTEYTGYPSASIYHDFRYNPKTVLHGAFLDWAYEHHGVFAISTELWDIIKLAGIEQRDFIEFMNKERSEEDEYKIYQWLDANIPGSFKNWTALDHPQLGPVEVGGWDFVYSWQNPPAESQLLKDTMHANMLFSLACCAMSPLLNVPVLDVESIGENLYKVTAVVENTGFLPTYISQKALERKFLQPVKAKLVVVEGVEIVSGQEEAELSHLEGRSNKQSVSPFQNGYASDYRAKVEWVVKANPGTKITVEAYAERAGRARRELAVI